MWHFLILIVTEMAHLFWAVDNADTSILVWSFLEEDSKDKCRNEKYSDEEPKVLQIPANVALFDSDSDGSWHTC